MYDSVLVAVDGSDPAAAATRQAVNLARTFDATLTVLSVLEERSWAHDLVGVETGDEPGRDDLDERTARSLDAAERLAAEAEVACRVAVERGIPNELIETYADATDADVVAMGTHGRTGLDRLLLGSVTERVLRTSDVPVLTTRAFQPERGDIDAILLPTDGSSCAERALDHALAHATRHDATLHALAAVDIRSVAAAYGAGPAVPDIIDDLREPYEQALDDVAERARDADITVETTLREATPHRVIDEYVDDHGIDLVTMGTHGRSGLERHLLGSVAERTIRTSDAPVLAVPA